MLQLKFHLFSFYSLPIWYFMTFAVTILSTKFFSTSGTPKLHYSYSSFSNTKVLILNLSSTIFSRLHSFNLKSSYNFFLSFSLHVPTLGLVRSLTPQQGHQRPSHWMYISHNWHRLWPMTYLDPFCRSRGFVSKTNISLQPLDGKPDTFLLLHSHFTHANFAIMANEIICWILTSARTSTSIIVHYLPSVEVEYKIDSPLSRQGTF